MIGRTIVARGPRRPRPVRWAPGPAIVRIFFRTLYENVGQLGSHGAIIPHSRVLKENQPNPLFHPVPQAFDIIAIVAAPASGTTTTLIDITLMGRVPRGFRAVIDGLATYAENAAGPITSLRIPGAGVVITWRLLLDGAPAFPYQNVTTILPDGIAPRPLLEIPSKKLLTVAVTNVDPGGFIAQLGVRLRGRLIPWDYDKSGGR